MYQTVIKHFYQTVIMTNERPYGAFLVCNVIKVPNIDQLLLKMGKKLRRYYQSLRIIYKSNFSRVSTLTVKKL